MRLILVFLFFMSLVLISFFVLEDTLMTMFTEEGSIAVLNEYGSIAWMVGMGLLIVDLFLPLPATIIMSALGYLYGFTFGFLINTTGSFASGSIAYFLCRSFGEKAALKILGSRDFERGKKISDKSGPWIVVLSRWLPVFPEVISCMAGLTRMNPIKFHLALLTGTIPLAMTYTYIGYAGIQNPAIAVVLSAALPPLIWFFASMMLNRFSNTRKA